MSESHLVFARKYRPQLFKDVVQQDIPVQAIQNAIKQNRVGHAYIFFGPRGVGKTTIARILAKRLNCENPQDAEPCNVCTSCTEITRGISNDVVEIDAASNRGIDDIRDLRDSVKYNAMGGKYRVYIIDEVHMLSLPAFNALLKTLEEPPKHVVFVLATTDYHKVPETILSRCQDFVFKKVSIEHLHNYVEKLCKIENLNYDNEGLFWIAKKGDGSVRDTLSFLEQAVTFTGGKLTGETVGKMIGYHGVTIQGEFINLLLNEENGTKAVGFIEKLFAGGNDLQKFLWDFIDYVHTAITLNENIFDRENINYPLEDIENIRNQTKNFRIESLTFLSERSFQIYDKLLTLRLRNSYELKVFLEIQIRKLVSDLSKPSVVGILSKINHLSELLKKDINSLPIEKSKIQLSDESNKETPKEVIRNTDNIESSIKDTFAGVEIDTGFPEIK
jgi:DNA polymerase-3 subunit gamma/tau